MTDSDCRLSVQPRSDGEELAHQADPHSEAVRTVYNNGWSGNLRASRYTCQPASALHLRRGPWSGLGPATICCSAGHGACQEWQVWYRCATDSQYRLQQSVSFGAACFFFGTRLLDGRMRAVCSCLLHLALRACIKSLPVKHRYSRYQHVSFPTWGCKVTFWIATSVCELGSAPNDPYEVTHLGGQIAAKVTLCLHHHNGTQKLVTITVQRRATGKRTQQQQQSCHCIAADVSRSA